MEPSIRAGVEAPIQQSFRPFIHVEGESTMPSGITLFAATGGRWNLIELPDEVVDLQLADQMPALAALMRRRPGAVRRLLSILWADPWVSSGAPG